MQINGENEMGTFMLYLIVICLLVMVYILFEIRSQLSRLRVSLERHLDGSRDGSDKIGRASCRERV